MMMGLLRRDTLGHHLAVRLCVLDTQFVANLHVSKGLPLVELGLVINRERNLSVAWVVAGSPVKRHHVRLADMNWLRATSRPYNSIRIISVLRMRSGQISEADLLKMVSASACTTRQSPLITSRSSCPKTHPA